MLYVDYSAWDHKPSNEEKAKVKALKKKQAELRKAKQWDEAKEIPIKIYAIQNGNKGISIRERMVSGCFCLFCGAYASLGFAIPFFIFTPTTPFIKHMSESAVFFGWPFVLAAFLYWFNLFPGKTKGSQKIGYAYAIYAGTILGKSVLTKYISADATILYIITSIISILICVVFWLIRKNNTDVNQKQGVHKPQ